MDATSFSSRGEQTSAVDERTNRVAAGVPLSTCPSVRWQYSCLLSFTAEPTERSGLQQGQEHFARRWRAPHRSSMRRVSAVAASGGVSMRRLLVGMIKKIV